MSFHGEKTWGMWGNGVRNAFEEHLRAAIARGESAVGAWRTGVGDTPTGRVLLVWREADVSEVVTKLRGEGRTLVVRTATTEEILAAGGHELRGAMGERDVSSARVVEVTP